MRNTPFTIPVYVLEASDVANYTEAARVKGELGQIRYAISEQLPDGFSATIGQADKGRRGTVTMARISGPGTRGVTLEIGDGVMIHERIGVHLVPAHMVAEAESGRPAAHDPNYTSALEDQLTDAEKLLLTANGDIATLRATVADMEARIEELEGEVADDSWTTEADDDSADMTPAKAKKTRRGRRGK
ncbi:MAG: hypothetical protein GY773_00890 [Actinomycetia bacterium]|nr:hypothetical protein [Actinomycetes bacterium]